MTARRSGNSSVRFRQTTAGLSDADINQAAIKRALDDATEKLAQATDWLLSNYRDDPDAPGFRCHQLSHADGLRVRRLADGPGDNGCSTKNRFLR